MDRVVHLGHFAVLIYHKQDLPSGKHLAHIYRLGLLGLRHSLEVRRRNARKRPSEFGVEGGHVASGCPERFEGRTWSLHLNFHPEAL